MIPGCIPNIALSYIFFWWKIIQMAMCFSSFIPMIPTKYPHQIPLSLLLQRPFFLGEVTVFSGQNSPIARWTDHDKCWIFRWPIAVIKPDLSRCSSYQLVVSVSSWRGTPGTILLIFFDWDFPWKKPSIWETLMTSWKPPHNAWANIRATCSNELRCAA